MTSEELQVLLNSCQSVKSDLNLIVISLRRRQLSGAHQCAKATIEILRNLLGRYNFSSADHMMKVVRAVGRELIAAAPSELTIGNLVRRVLFLIREEHAGQVKEFGAGVVQVFPTKRDRSGSNMSNGDASAAAAAANNVLAQSLAGSGGDQAHSQSSAAPLESILDQLNIQSSASINAEDFTRYYAGLKGNVIGAINELYNEIDNVAVICQRAQEHIHTGELILTYGYSRIVEQFLKAAGAKRKFQLVVAESNPGLDGHKLAQSLSKVPSIGVTLIPDSNIYALMARVNKVILSPNAVTADGGAICPSGMLMVCIAAKELSVPVVCVTGAFTLTPLFAHNQSSVLNQLLSPADALPYNANINVNNVEVNHPAFDYVPPDLISLYVTNDGNQLPSYVFRQLSEYYHPQDYYIL
eukprot:gene18234-20763_t